MNQHCVNDPRLSKRIHTIEHPVSFLLALVSMNAHCWPPETGKSNEYSPLTQVTQSWHSKAEQAILPIPTHPPGEIVTPFLGLHKNNGLVLLLAHDFLQQAHESEKIKW